MWKGIMECGRWTNDVREYAESVVIFQKSRKCFRGHQVIVYFEKKMQNPGTEIGTTHHRDYGLSHSGNSANLANSPP